MERETIDLTTPIPQVLKNSNWTEDKHSNNAAQTKENESNVQNIYSLSAHESNQLVVEKTEDTIVLSDDDEICDTSKNSCEVTEVKVFEVFEDSDSSEEKSQCVRQCASDNNLPESTATTSQDISYNNLPCSITKIEQSQCFSVDLTGSDSEEETRKAPLFTSMKTQEQSMKADVVKTICAIDYLKESSSENLNVDTSFEGIHATITPIMVVVQPEISMPKIIDVRSLNTQTTDITQNTDEGSCNPKTYETLGVQKSIEDDSITNDNIISTEKETRNFIFDKVSDENVSESDFAKIPAVVENTENPNNKSSFYFDETISSDMSLDSISTNVKIAVDSILKDTVTLIDVKQNLNQKENSKSQVESVKVLDINALNSDVIEIEELNDLPESRQDALNFNEDNTTVQIDKTIALSTGTEPDSCVEESSNTTAFDIATDNLVSSNHLQENTTELEIEEAEQSINSTTSSDFKNTETLNCDGTTSRDVNADCSENILNDKVVKSDIYTDKEDLEEEESRNKTSDDDLLLTSQLNKEQVNDNMDNQKEVSEIANLINSNTKSVGDLGIKDKSVNFEEESLNGKDSDLGIKSIPNLNTEEPVLPVEENSTRSSIGTATTSEANLVLSTKSNEENDSVLVESHKEIMEDSNSSASINISLNVQTSSGNQSLESKVRVSDIVNDQISVNNVETNSEPDKCEEHVIMKNIEEVSAANSVEVVKDDKIETSHSGKVNFDVDKLEDNKISTNLFLKNIDETILTNKNLYISKVNCTKENSVVSNLSIQDSQTNDLEKKTTEKSEEYAMEENTELKQLKLQEINYQEEEKNKQNQTALQENCSAVLSATTTLIGESKNRNNFVRRSTDSSSDDVFEELQGSKSIQDTINLPEFEKTVQEKVFTTSPRDVKLLADPSSDLTEINKIIAENVIEEQSMQVCENVESNDKDSLDTKQQHSNISIEVQKEDQKVGEINDESQQHKIINKDHSLKLDKLKSAVNFQLTKLETNNKIGVVQSPASDLLNPNKKNVKYLMVKKNLILKPNPIDKIILTKLNKPLKPESMNDHTSMSNQEEETDTRPNVQSESSTKEETDHIEQSEESATESDINSFGVKSALSLEDVRKNLKMQLTSLRMRKKMDIFQNVKQTINNEPMYSQKHDENIASSSKITEPVNIPPVINKSTDPQTTDTTNENPEVSYQENEDLPNVFNEIRKIIRKQKPLPTESSYSSKTVSSFKTTVTNTTSSENSNDSILEIPCKNTKITTIPNLSAAKIEKFSDSKGSPFVSNSLDEFLTDSKLNVSYVIPKSGAEEGLRQSNYNDPIMLVDPKIKSEDNSDKPKEKTEYKPKTLAEKRKIFERKKRMEEKRLNKQKYLKERRKGSYVLFKNEKVFVKSRTTGKCLAAVESTISKADLESSEPQTSPSKPSLLQEYYRKTTKLKFMPGPLSKKHLLQSDYSEWRSELKPLPKCVVELLPEFMKPVHPNLLPHVLKQWNAEISEDHLEFALAALDNKENLERTKTFEFNVNYERSQDKVLCRKKIKDHLMGKLIEPIEEDEIKPPVQVYESEVAKVVEDLIRYVEIKELAPSLIKEDTDSAPLDDPVEMVCETIESKPMTKKRQPRRLACTNRELLRLNCKVISVDVKENEPKVKCSKPYCQLGCVCESLNCPTIIGAHCRKTKCLFMCTCPKSKNRVINITLPSNNGELLSVDAVTRIEDEAKRNLAREEKEFTQTVIYSQEGALVVGSGYKSRRVTKTPRKYTEFFEDIDDIVETPKRTYATVKPCSVELERHNFSSITPYCLVHYLYDCHCEGYSRLFPKNTSKSVYETRKRSFKKSNSISDEDFIKEESSESFDSSTGRSIRKKKCTTKPDYVLWSSSSRLHKSRPTELTKPHTYILGPDGCARVNKVDKKYLDSKPLTEEATAGDFVNNLTESDLLKQNLNKDIDEKLLSDCDRLKKDILVMAKSIVIQSNVRRTGHKRKQELKIRQYGSNDNQTAQSSASIKSRVTPVFPGEIIVTDPLWLQKLSRNTDKQNCLVGSYARILPWAALIQGFILKMVNIYCVYDTPLRLLLNVGPKLKGKNLLDIETNNSFILQTPLKGTAPWLVKQSENIRDIVKWLLTGALSPKYNPQTLSFLLVETAPGQFEVRGLCTQTQKLQGPPSETKSESDSIVKQEDIPKPVSTKVISEEISNEPTEVKHKNMRGEVVSLFISRLQFPLRELVEDGCDDDLTDNLYMWVSLPEVKKVAKWRVVFLNQEFVYLHFKNVDYSIKHNDLDRLTQIAKEENTTLLVKNGLLRRNHNHAEFGIYISPKYTDRIFIGPYLINYDEEDLDQLKYISKILVSSQTLHKMKGNDRFKCGHWMYESSYNQPPEVVSNTDTVSNKAKPSATITKKSETVPDVPYTSTQVKPVQITEEPVQIVQHNGFAVRIKTTKPRQPGDFNRYIITNIPHFGYLGAYQPDNSSVLEVSWPFERKVLEFDNADNARDFLQERFNQLLQPVPETFKLQVIVLIHLDLKEHKPIRSDFLNGQCICSCYGAFHLKELSERFCLEKFRMSKSDITLMFAKRAQDYVMKKLQELAIISGIDVNQDESYNVSTILIKAQQEIKRLESERRTMMCEVQSIENSVVQKVTKVFEMIKKLPPKYRNIESRVLNEILQIRPQRVTASGVIEIIDDDKPTGKATATKTAGPSHIGKGQKRKVPDCVPIRVSKIAKGTPWSTLNDQSCSTKETSQSNVNDIL